MWEWLCFAERLWDGFLNFGLDSIPSDTGGHLGRPSKFMHLSEPIQAEQDDSAKFDKQTAGVSWNGFDTVGVGQVPAEVEGYHIRSTALQQ